MGTIRKFEGPEIWQIARQLSLKVFHLIEEAPSSGDYKFKNQIRASAGSVMDNIVEGFDRSGQFELVNFLSIAKGSIGETRSQLYRASIKNIFLKTPLI